MVCYDLRKNYPQLSEILNKTKRMRREEIIENLRVSDDFYNEILIKRKNQSVSLVEGLSEDSNAEYEQYMDLVFEQVNYELNAIYEFAFHDAVKLLEKLNMLGSGYPKEADIGKSASLSNIPPAIQSSFLNPPHPLLAH